MTMEPKIEDQPLFEYVLDQLDKARGTMPEVAAGAGIPYNTLVKIAQRRVPNPGVLTIQRLADYFRARAADAELIARARREAGK